MKADASCLVSKERMEYLRVASNVDTLRDYQQRPGGLTFRSVTEFVDGGEVTIKEETQHLQTRVGKCYTCFHSSGVCR